MHDRAVKIFQAYKDLLILGLLGIPIGLVVGGIDAVFGRVLLAITDFRNGHPMQLIPFLAFAGALIAFAYLKFGGKSSKGMNLIFEVGHGEEEVIPLRLIPFIISGTWITHLFGGSAGREGVAVQIGATFSHWIGRKIPLKNSSHIFLVTGMAAGFAGLFGTPIAAVFFAMEVLTAGALEYQVLLPAVTAAFTASAAAQFLGLEKFTFALTGKMDLAYSDMWRFLLLGILFGVVGGAFAWTLKYMKNILASHWKQPVIRIFIMGLILSVLLLLLYKGRYAGLGTNLIHASFYGEEILSYDWILKFLLTVLTLAAGFQGGEVTPLFSIGASLGVVAGPILGVPSEIAAALGYAGVFGSATNTFLAPVLIGTEVFGSAYLPHFFLVCAFAYLFNLNKSIYSLQKTSDVHK
ncbi:chloride channel protein [Blautia sp.]|uniref:chloride channel protein n=1 Tax=Blautia sp. TaxID=1955243 RepID=UPI0025860898|nr:chloride channel protein [Blautia sp.]